MEEKERLGMNHERRQNGAISRPLHGGDHEVEVFVCQMCHVQSFSRISIDSRSASLIVGASDPSLNS